MVAAEEKKNMLRLHVDDSQMEWVCEQHQKGKYLYTNTCCNQVIGLQRDNNEDYMGKSSLYMKLQIFTGLDALWSSNIHNILFTWPDVISLVLLTSYKENYRTYAPEI
jgi:hypothetical protein